MQSKEHSAKVRVLVRQIAEIRHIVVSSETDALLLENSFLIKTLQPRYNILLKDDKTYPWIVVRREHFPRVQSTGQLDRATGRSTSWPLRAGGDAAQRARISCAKRGALASTCKLNLAPRADRQGEVFGLPAAPFRATAKGPCVGAQGEAGEHGTAGRHGRSRVLMGDLRPVRSYLEQEMQRGCRELKSRIGAALQAAPRCAGQLCGQVGDRQCEDRRRGCFFAASGRRCGLLQFRAYPPRVGRGRLYGETRRVSGATNATC
ncbi:MAG: hypothetical protein ACLUQ6_10130 [Alistipes onderdonkii]